MCQMTISDEGYPRRFSLVRLMNAPGETFHPDAARLSKDEVYVFLGEIPNMPGHCVVADYATGRIHAGCHTGGFEELSVGEMKGHSHAPVHAHAMTGGHQGHFRNISLWKAPVIHEDIMRICL